MSWVKRDDTAELAAAAWIALDDMGDDFCVSGYAKAKIRLALEPFLPLHEDDPDLNYTAEMARQVVPKRLHNG